MENKSTSDIDASAFMLKDSPEEDRIDKIRDLLFGEQIAGYDRRFEELEKSLMERIDQLSASVQAKLDALDDTTVKREKLAKELEDLARILSQGTADPHE